MRLALYPLVQQFQFRNGTNLVAGRIYVYYRGRTRLATIYKDQNGTIAQNPLTCDADGRAPCFVDTNYQYTIVVCDARGKELFSQDLDADNAININDALSGDSKLYIINSDGTISVNATSGDTWIQYDLGTFNKPLGVQAPLYWAQDDEECSIIGASGLATTEEINHVSGVVDTKLDKTELSAFVENQLEPTIANIEHDISHISGVVDTKVDNTEYNEFVNDVQNEFSGVHDDVDFLSGQIDTKHDTTAFNSYSGSVKNTFDYISGQVNTKLPTNTFNSYSSNVNGQITHISGVVDNKVNKNTFDNFTRDEGLRDNFLSGEIDKKYDTTAFNSVSGSFLTAIPDDVVREDELTAYQPIGDYYSASNPSGFITNDALEPYQLIEDMTAYQPIGNYQTAGDYYSASNPSGFITGVDLSDYALSADVSSELSDKLDITAFSTVSGDFLQANDITGKQDIEGMTAYQTIAGMTAYQPTGDYLTTADSAQFYTTANESGFITGVDLSPYQTIEGMTAYQPVGDYLSSTDSAEFLLTSDSANFMLTGERSDFYPMNSNPSGYLTAHQSLTALMSSDKLEFTPGGKISGYDGSGFLGGGGGSFSPGDNIEIDGDIINATGVLVESGLEFNENNKISGYNGSAFAGDDADEYALIAGPGLELFDNNTISATTINITGFEYDSENKISGFEGSALSVPKIETTNLYVDQPLFVDVNNGYPYIGIGKYDDCTELWTGSLTGNTSARLLDVITNYRAILVSGGDLNSRSPWIQLYDTTLIRSYASAYPVLQCTAMAQHTSNANEIDVIYFNMSSDIVYARAEYYFKNNGAGYFNNHKIAGISGLGKINA